MAVKLHRSNETYAVTFPTRHLTGLASGAVTAMLGGDIVIHCAASGYRYVGSVFGGGGVAGWGREVEGQNAGLDFYLYPVHCAPHCTARTVNTQP